MRLRSCHERVIIALLLLTQAFSLTYLARRWGYLSDEPAHLVSGLVLIEHGSYDLYRVNPPVTRLLAGVLPALLAAPEIPERRYYFVGVGGRSEFELGNEFRRSNRELLPWLIFLARLPFVVVCVIGTLLIWSIARPIYGRRASLFAAAFWASSPWTLTTGAAALSDMPVAVAGMAAAWSIRRQLLEPTWTNAAACSALNTAALLCKFSWLPVTVVLVFIGLIKALRARSFRLAGMVAASMLLSIAILQGAYNFEAVAETWADQSYRSKSMQRLVTAVDYLRLSGLPTLLPKQFLLGLDTQLIDQETLGKSMPSYLCGEFRDVGWYSYYALGLLLKTPVALIALCVLGSASLARFRKRGEIHLLWPALVVFAVLSQQTGFNHHLRYVLPVIPATIWIACRLLRGVTAARWLGGPALILSLGSVGWSFPHTYGYFNLLAGGPYNGHLFFADTNLEWGQDSETLRRWLTALRQEDAVFVANRTEPVAVDEDWLNKAEPPHTVLIDDVHVPVSAGYYLISSSAYVKPRYAWFRGRRPYARPSPGLFVFHVGRDEVFSVPLESLQRHRGQMRP